MKRLNILVRKSFTVFEQLVNRGKIAINTNVNNFIQQFKKRNQFKETKAVSYTHLTLPTNREV